MSDESLLRRGGVAYAGIPLAEMMAGLIWGCLASMGMGAEACRAQSGLTQPRAWAGDALSAENSNGEISVEMAVPLGGNESFWLGGSYTF
jgi:hypothetical protein